MEVPKQNINYELIDPTTPLFPQVNVYYIGVVLFIVIGYITYNWMIYKNNINTPKILEGVERKIKEWREYFTFHFNKLLLQINMEGNAIKTTQPLSYNILSKM